MLIDLKYLVKLNNKTMRNNSFTFLLLIFLVFGCKNINSSAQDLYANQTIQYIVDDKEFVVSMADEDLCLMNYTKKSNLVFTIGSIKKDINFTISAFIENLKPGTYQIWDCKIDSKCTQAEEKKNQSAVFTPFPKSTLTPISSLRMSYKIPELGLKPMILTITSITDEQQNGVPYKTKRVKGLFNGVMANVTSQENGKLQIVGKTTNIEGEFNMFCGIR